MRSTALLVLGAAAFLAWWPVLPAAAQAVGAGTANAVGVLPGGGSVQEAANGVLRILGYTAVPDNTLSSLSIEASDRDTAVLRMFRTGGAFTVSDEVPIYLEGFFGLARYDPKFVFSDGTQERLVPTRWNSAAVTGGVGYDIALTEKLVVRPIGNVSLGYVASDLAVLGRVIESELDVDVGFLDDGELFAYGLGGSLMLDYEDYKKDGELDIELRYTFIRLQSFGGTSSGFKGRADAQSADLWTRYRWPTGVQLLDRPLRYVLQGSHTSYVGDQGEVLGFNHLTKVGAGVEIETTSLSSLITRVRIIASVSFGENVRGGSLGLAASF